MPRLDENPLRKTAKHIPARNVCGILVAEDAALLTQGKDDKAKRTEQSRWNAAGVRLPLDYFLGPSYHIPDLSVNQKIFFSEHD
ncbi:MAG: hypothetical protein IJA33_03300 [Oscillospiraceae bacterium]|nr:hypothetical protein [Oscillospiraceae bacterium]